MMHACWRHGLVAVFAGAILGTGCASRTRNLSEEARAAIASTRGLCPTDLNQSRVLVSDREDGLAMVFMTDDPSKIPALHRRVAEMAEAMQTPHPAVNAKGEVITHSAAPKAELQDVEDGVQLVLRAADPNRRQILASQAEDHARVLRRGECPVMTDPSVRQSETAGWPRTDR